MGLSKSIGNYAEHENAMKQALISGRPITVTLPTPGKATRWRMEAYMFRRLLLERDQANSKLTGLHPRTPYDRLALYTSGCAVIIKHKLNEAVVTVGGAHVPKTDASALPHEIQQLLLDTEDDT
jgi:hypothetical protein